MERIDSDWLRDFDAAMLVFFAINHGEAGMDERELGWYVDLPARQAALTFGEDFDLCRVDVFWPDLAALKTLNGGTRATNSVPLREIQTGATRDRLTAV